MTKLAFAMSLAVAALVAGPAYAQSGETGAAGSKAPSKATAEEKYDAKMKRKAEGKAATGKTAMGETGTEAGGAQPKATKDERVTAKMKRRAEAKDAQKKGETQSGETGK